jgi:hypothetical protein
MVIVKKYKKKRFYQMSEFFNITKNNEYYFEEII